MALFIRNISDCLVEDDTSIKDAIKSLELSQKKIVLVISKSGDFLGTIVDGDIRRGLIKGLTLEDTIMKIANQNPFFVRQVETDKSIIAKMAQHQVMQVPLVIDNKVKGLYLWENQTKAVGVKNNSFVIMAGGQGVRLRPLTLDCPKPLLKIDDTPIIERLITNAKLAGFENIKISIGYLGNLIKEHLGTGENLGVNINYSHEKEPTGTAGSLKNFKFETNEDFIVVNGDLITDINYSDLIDFHKKNNATITMVGRQYTLENPFGVIETIGNQVKQIKEKPTILSMINCGVYCLSKNAINLIPSDKAFDMPDLINKHLEKSLPVFVYEFSGDWYDIGTIKDFERVNLFNKVSFDE